MDNFPVIEISAVTIGVFLVIISSLVTMFGIFPILKDAAIDYLLGIYIVAVSIFFIFRPSIIPFVKMSQNAEYISAGLLILAGIIGAGYLINSFRHETGLAKKVGIFLLVMMAFFIVSVFDTVFGLGRIPDILKMTLGILTVIGIIFNNLWLSDRGNG